MSQKLYCYPWILFIFFLGGWSANNGIIIIVDLFFFSVVFFPSFYSIQSAKKDVEDELVFSFFLVFSDFAVLWPVAALLPRPSAVTCAPCRAGGVLSRLLSICEFQRGNAGWRCAVVGCGLT